MVVVVCQQWCGGGGGQGQKPPLPLPVVVANPPLPRTIRYWIGILPSTRKRYLYHLHSERVREEQRLDVAVEAVREDDDDAPTTTKEAVVVARLRMAAAVRKRQGP